MGFMGLILSIINPINLINLTSLLYEGDIENRAFFAFVGDAEK